jgi:hypothetical protein
MSYALVDVELTAPMPSLLLGDGESGLAIVSRREGHVVGYAIHPLAPGTRLAPEEVAALLDPAPVQLPPVAAGDQAGPRVTVVVCTRDRTELLAGCLDALLPQIGDADEVVVVDNAPSSTGTRDLVAGKPVRYEVEPVARPRLRPQPGAAGGDRGRDRLRGRRRGGRPPLAGQRPRRVGARP